VNRGEFSRPTIAMKNRPGNASVLASMAIFSAKGIALIGGKQQEAVDAARA